MLKKAFTRISSGNTDNEAELSYDQLRWTVGLLALALVPTLILMGWIDTQDWSKAIQPSISDHYHTPLGRNVFVGTLCAIGLFFCSYSPYGNGWDRWLGKFAGTCVIVTALVRTTPDVFVKQSCSGAACLDVAGIVHFVAAALFFASLAVYCLVFFVQTKPGAIPSECKRNRNRIFLICGWTIVGSVALIGLINLVPPLKALVGNFRYVFVLEAVSVFAFAIAWIVKGKLGSGLGILKGRLYD